MEESFCTKLKAGARSLMCAALALSLIVTLTPAVPAYAAQDATVATDQAKQVKVAKPKPLAFKNSKVVKTFGDKAFTNKLIKQKSVKGALVYTSSNKAVATVSAKGKVKIRGVGATTIKVKSRTVRKSASKTAKYTLTVKPKTAAIRKVQGAVGGFSVNWKAMSSAQAGGYQIRYADNDSLRDAQEVTVKKASTTFALITGLESGAEYYVQVRAYKRVKGKTYYGDWSKTKAVLTGLNSGDEELDAIVAQLLSTKKLKSGSPDKRLQACFNYVVKMKYIRNDATPRGDWSVPFAKEMYNNKGGNCYRYAALLCWLARGLGYDATAVKGAVLLNTRGRAPHGWVEISKDGKTYVCDPEMTHSLKTYNLFMLTYHESPISYRKSK